MHPNRLASLVAILAFALTGCLGPIRGVITPGTAGSSDVIVLNPEAMTLAGRAVGYVRLNAAWPSSSRAVQAIPGSTSQFRLTVTASDLTVPLTYVAQRPNGAATSSVQVAVPAGNGRSLLVEALGPSNRVLANFSQGGLTVTPGQYTPVTAALVSLVGNITGTVLNNETLLPEPGVTVTASDSSAITDASGSYLLSDLATGPVPVLLSKTRFAGATQSAAVISGTTSSAGTSTLTRLHWTEQVSGTSNNLRSIQALSATESWASGDGSTLLHTVDGGLNWNLIALPAATPSGNTTYRVADVRFAPGTSTGYAVTSYGCFKTTDGGVTWNQTPGNLAGGNVLVFDANTVTSLGYASGFRIAASLDGGQTVTLKGTQGVDDNTAYGVSPSLFWMTYSSGLYKSNSGGASWQQVTPGTLAFNGGTLRTVVGYGNTVLVGGYRQVGSNYQKAIVRSQDGGGTWSTDYTDPAVTTGTFPTFRGLTLVGANGACAVGTEGAIAFLAPGSANWVAQVPQTTNISGLRLNAVSFVDPNNGWAVGEGGRILRY